MNNVEDILSSVYSIQCTKYDIYHNKTHFPPLVGKPRYGEITYEGVEKLVQYFKKYFNKNTVFYDLGCGLGKMVIHIGLKYGVKKACGIEYSVERYNGCMDNYKKGKNDNIEFINGSYYDTPLDNATVIYVDDTAYLDKDELKKLHSLPPVGCLVLHRSILWQHYHRSQEINDFFPTTYSPKNQLYYYIKA